MTQSENAPVTGVCYVEVNSNSLANVARYSLTSGRPLFDVGIIFAANINYNTQEKKAYLYFNSNVQHVLDNPDVYIKPLKERGIKVTLSVLGNHQGAGISNFPDQAAAEAFAQELKDAVDKYDLDGVDFDDEYADYGTNGTGQPNDFSFVYLITALRKLMPDKIISFYFIGPASQRLSYDGVTVGSQINYSWNAYYGTFSVPDVPDLPKSGLSPAATDVTSTSPGMVKSLAQQTMDGGFGVFMYYNLTSTDAASLLSNASQVLYGENTVFS